MLQKKKRKKDPFRMTCILIFGDDKRASVNSSRHADPNLF